MRERKWFKDKYHTGDRGELGKLDLVGRAPVSLSH
jgi:hypothetical protein